MDHQLMVHLSLLLQQRLHAQHVQQPEQYKPLLKMILGQKDVGQLPYMLLSQEWMNGASPIALLDIALPPTASAVNRQSSKPVKMIYQLNDAIDWNKKEVATKEEFKEDVLEHAMYVIDQNQFTYEFVLLVRISF